MFAILVVCMGNICRSPLAASVMLAELERRQLSKAFSIDSAGTYGGRRGEKADPRAIESALARGYSYIKKQRARPVEDRDFDRFDLILAMDKDNLGQLQSRCPPEMAHKLHLFLDFAQCPDEDEVPDPYYGNAAGFERVLDLCEVGARGVLDRLSKQPE